MSLEFNQVTYTYPGSRYGVFDISFSIGTGELVAVIGPSGSGKSTLLRLVSGLATGHSGAIVLGGEDLSGKPVHQRNIGMVFQNYALFPHLDVAANVAYGLKLRKVEEKERRQRALELLSLMGLEEYASASVSQLSGGQQQRVALARALAIDPKALLLDEPLAALDASIRGYLRDQIRTIQKRFNTTTLLVTHDQEEALAMADQVAVLKDGKLIQLAPPKEIYAHPTSKAVAEFVGLSSIFEAKISGQDEIDTGAFRLKTDTGKRTPGQTVFALIRPEHVVPNPEAHAINRLAGQVGTERYLGAVYRYDFQIADAPKSLLVESHNLAEHTVSIPPEHIRLLDE